MERHNVTVKTTDGNLSELTPDEAMKLYKYFKYLYEDAHSKAVTIPNGRKYREKMMDTANYFYNKSIEIQRHIFGDDVGHFEIDKTKIESA